MAIVLISNLRTKLFTLLSHSLLHVLRRVFWSFFCFLFTDEKSPEQPCLPALSCEDVVICMEENWRVCACVQYTDAGAYWNNDYRLLGLKLHWLEQNWDVILWGIFHAKIKNICFCQCFVGRKAKLFRHICWHLWLSSCSWHHSFGFWCSRIPLHTNIYAWRAALIVPFQLVLMLNDPLSVFLVLIL